MTAEFTSNQAKIKSIKWHAVQTGSPNDEVEEWVSDIEDKLMARKEAEEKKKKN